MTGLTAVCIIFWEEALESLAAKPFIHSTYQLIVSIFFFLQFLLMTCLEIFLPYTQLLTQSQMMRPRIGQLHVREV